MRPGDADLADLGPTPRESPTFGCTPIHPRARATLQADVLVSISNLPTSITLMLTNEEARELAMTILRKTEQPRLVDFTPRKDS